MIIYVVVASHHDYGPIVLGVYQHNPTADEITNLIHNDIKKRYPTWFNHKSDISVEVDKYKDLSCFVDEIKK